MIYRKVTEMYYIDRLQIVLWLYQGWAFFLCGFRKIGSWIVCILLALPGVLQRCADWRAITIGVTLLNPAQIRQILIVSAAW